MQFDKAPHARNEAHRAPAVRSRPLAYRSRVRTLLGIPDPGSSDAVIRPLSPPLVGFRYANHPAVEPFFAMETSASSVPVEDMETVFDRGVSTTPEASRQASVESALVQPAPAQHEVRSPEESTRETVEPSSVGEVGEGGDSPSGQAAPERPHAPVYRRDRAVRDMPGDAYSARRRRAPQGSPDDSPAHQTTPTESTATRVQRFTVDIPGISERKRAFLALSDTSIPPALGTVSPAEEPRQPVKRPTLPDLKPPGHMLAVPDVTTAGPVAEVSAETVIRQDSGTVQSLPLYVQPVPPRPPEAPVVQRQVHDSERSRAAAPGQSPRPAATVASRRQPSVASTHLSALRNWLSVESPLSETEASAAAPALPEETARRHDVRLERPHVFADLPHREEHADRFHWQTHEHIEHLQNAVQRLAATVSSQSQNKGHEPAPETMPIQSSPPAQPLVIVQRPGRPSGTPRAFWERRHLGRFRLRTIW
jgi:hypothetical protein